VAINQISQISEAPMTDEMNPERILRQAQAFMESRILLTAAELNLFTFLKKTPLTAQQTALKTGGDVKSLSALLDALAAMGLLKKKEDTYFCDPSVTQFLADDSPVTVRPMVLHMASLWTRWSRLTATVKGIPAPTKQLDFTGNPEELQAFIGAMHSIGSPLAKQIVAAIDPGAARSFLDVGGGSGTYTIAFLQASPEMKATIFDLPEVIEMARTRLTREGLIDRTTLAAGNYHQDELPGGQDLVLLSAIIHSNSPDHNLSLYRKIFRALQPGGRLLIRDHVMDPDRVQPKDGAIFAINMLVGTLGGSTYTYEEIESGLSQAGFTRIRLLRQGEHMDAVVEAFRP
jgi:SAM-dependent methyltransferase